MKITAGHELVRQRRHGIKEKDWASGPGRVALSFSGRIGASRLAPGSYLMSVTAIDAAGNRSRPANVAFTVVSR